MQGAVSPRYSTSGVAWNLEGPSTITARETPYAPRTSRSVTTGITKTLFTPLPSHCIGLDGSLFDLGSVIAIS